MGQQCPSLRKNREFVGTMDEFAEKIDKKIAQESRFCYAIKIEICMVF